MPCDILIVAAFSPELSGLEMLLGPSMTESVGGARVAARPVGVGLVCAAAGASLSVARVSPSAVVLVGTCGAYPGSGLGIGDVVLARWVALVEPAAVEQEAAFPAPMATRLAADAELTAGLAACGGTPADVATTLAVTTSDALSSRLAKGSGAAVEHLEAFAVATACAAAGVRFAAVLAVANAVGSVGREQWRAHHMAAGRAAASLVERWLVGGASGALTRAG